MNSTAEEFNKTVQFLYSRLPMYQRVGASAFKKDLSNTLKLCDFLGNPQHKFKSAHVAGTNGKGSSSHYLAAVFQSAGYKTGLYTSPHLKNFTERVKINGVEVDQEFVVSFVNRIKPLIEEIRPSFFEITVAMAFDYFANEQVDLAIIEVGMGGRLDSTNVILPEVSLITNISLDHQQWLGDTIEKIATEKAGIIKQNRPVVVSEKQDATMAVFGSISKEKLASLYYAEDDFEVNSTDVVEVLEKGDLLFKLPQLSIPSYQCKNIIGVLKTLEVLKQRGFHIPNKAVKAGLESTNKLTGLKGRWQKLGDNPLTFCDVGHNEAGVDFVLDQINSYDFQRLHIVIGMVDDKDVEKILVKFPQEAVYYFCQATIPRAMKAEELEEVASIYGLKGRIVKDVNKAISTAKQEANPEDFIFVGGSNFVVAEIENL